MRTGVGQKRMRGGKEGRGKERRGEGRRGEGKKGGEEGRGAGRREEKKGPSFQCYATCIKCMSLTL